MSRARRDNSGRTVWYAYNSSGYLSKFYDASGGLTSYAHDSAGRMMSYTTPNGNVAVQNQFDSNNHVTTQTRADGGTFTLSYTPSLGGPVTATNMTGTRGMTCEVASQFCTVR